MKKMVFLAAMTAAIGPLAGQSKTDWAREIRSLSAADKAWFVTELAKVGYEIIESEHTAAAKVADKQAA